MNSYEKNMLLKSVAKDLGLKDHYTTTNIYKVIHNKYCSGVYIPAYRRPLDSKGCYTKYFKILKYIYNAGVVQSGQIWRMFKYGHSNWQALRYSDLLKKVGYRGNYTLSAKGREYVERVEAIKQLYDREKEWER